MKKRTTTLQELIHDGKCHLRPLVAIPLQAQMAEALGYEVVGISGAARAPGYGRPYPRDAGCRPDYDDRNGGKCQTYLRRDANPRHPGI
jgi:hypothetical protein